MRFFGQAVLRLLRENWDGQDQELAEEIYAVLDSDIPLTFDGPITINNPGTDPAITINQNGGGDVDVRVNTTDGLGNITDTSDTSDGGGGASEGDTTSNTYSGVVVEITENVWTVNTTFKCKVFIAELVDEFQSGGQIGVVTVTIPASSEELDLPDVGDTVIVVRDSHDNFTIFSPNRTVYVGEVLGGSGTTYSVMLWGSRRVVTATVPGISTTATVPVGSKGTVVRYGANLYYLMVPTWL